MTREQIQQMIDASITQERRKRFGLTDAERREAHLKRKAEDEQRLEKFSDNDEPEERGISVSQWSDSEQNYFILRVNRFAERNKIESWDDAVEKFMASDEWDPESIQKIGSTFTGKRIAVNFDETEQVNQDLALKIERFQAEQHLPNFGEASEKYFRLHPIEGERYLAAFGY